MNNQSQPNSRSFRWFIAVALLGVVIAVLVQWRVISNLRREKQARSEQQPIAVANEPNASVSAGLDPLASPPAETLEQEQLRKEKTELLQLRNEVNQLRQQVAPRHPGEKAGAEQRGAPGSAQLQPLPNATQRSGLTAEWTGMENFAHTNYARALEELATATNELNRYFALGAVAKLSFAFGKTEEARNSASELLALAQKYQGQNWNDGQSVHDSNLVLGRLAVEEGLMEEAKQYLLEAGKSTGSPVLGSFGPNMSLAKDLLEKGEREAVLQYFELCGKFWQNETLNRWAEDVRAGRMPDFGANLIY